MNVTCPNCSTVYRVDPAKVPEAGVRARCAVCSAVFAVRRETEPARAPASVAARIEPVNAEPHSPLPPPSDPPRPVPPKPEPPKAAPPRAEPFRPEPARAAPPVAPPAARPAPATPAAVPPRPSAPPRPATPGVSPGIGASPTAGSAAPARPAAPAGTPPAPAPAKPAPAPAPTPPARPTSGARPANPFLSQDPALKARRLARALISDMVVYHPAKRQDGLRDGNLKELFEEEIKKSWEEYAEQVGREVAESTPYFREALNEILAGGRPIF
jgi:predicted Zn finger-like uncharacterized protein